MRAELNAENAVIGSILVSAKCLDDIVGEIEAGDFENETMRDIYRAALKLRERKTPVDPVTILGELEGGEQYNDLLLELMELTPTAANAVEYARIMKANAKRRRLQRIAGDIESGILLGQSWSKIAESVSEELTGLGGEAYKATEGAAATANWVKHYFAIKNDPDLAYCKTGYRSLDRALGGGMFNGEVYILAGRPGMGKTTQGIGIAERITKAGRPVLFASLEMSETQITAKRLALASGISYTRLLNGTLSEDEEKDTLLMASNISDRPFFVADSASTAADIEKYARGIKDIGAVIVDYLGLIQTGDKPAPRYEEVTRISASLKAMAKRLNKPVLVLAQLNRENTTRADKRPTLSDLRDSGAIEQDAGGVIMLHRESYYRPDEEPPETEPIELIIAKNRHAAPCTLKMIWHGATGQIMEMVGGLPF